MSAVDLGYQPLTPEEEAEALAYVERGGLADTSATMVGRLLATVDQARATWPESRAAARLRLQEKWDECARDFAEAVKEKCYHGEDSPELRDARHVASDLWLDLDDCWPCDDDPGVNYVYGQLHGVHAVAVKLGVKLDERFPPRSPSDEGGD